MREQKREHGEIRFEHSRVLRAGSSKLDTKRSSDHRDSFPSDLPQWMWSSVREGFVERPHSHHECTCGSPRSCVPRARSCTGPPHLGVLQRIREGILQNCGYPLRVDHLVIALVVVRRTAWLAGPAFPLTSLVTQLGDLDSSDRDPKLRSCLTSATDRMPTATSDGSPSC